MRKILFGIIILFLLGGCKKSGTSSYESDIERLGDAAVFVIGEEIDFGPDLSYTHYTKYNDIVSQKERVYIIINYQETQFGLSNENLIELERKLLIDGYAVIFTGLQYCKYNLDGYEFISDSSVTNNTNQLLVTRFYNSEETDYEYVRRIVAADADAEMIVYGMKRIYEL